jgi:hypothetical protein
MLNLTTVINGREMSPSDKLEHIVCIIANRKTYFIYAIPLKQFICLKFYAYLKETSDIL